MMIEDYYSVYQNVVLYIGKLNNLWIEQVTSREFRQSSLSSSLKCYFEPIG